MNPSFLETIDLIETPLRKKHAPKTGFFAFHSAGMGVFEEKTSNPYSVPNFP